VTIDAGSLDNPSVQPYGNRRPTYPALARQAGIEGWVEVEVLVGLDGRVFQARVVKWEGHPGFGDATLEVARGWRFPPPVYRGARVQMRYIRRIAFRLQE
jgi:protein TonB